MAFNNSNTNDLSKSIILSNIKYLSMKLNLILMFIMIF